MFTCSVQKNILRLVVGLPKSVFLNPVPGGTAEVHILDIFLIWPFHLSEKWKWHETAKNGNP